MADNRVNSGLLEFSEEQKVFIALDAETGEVEKGVVIDEDGVETNFVGIVPTGNINITGTTAVNVTNYATAQVVDEDLVAGNIKKDVDILGVVGTYEPEAPASDFYKPVITLEATGVPSSIAGYTIQLTETPAESFVAGVAVDEIGLSVDSLSLSVEVGTPVTVDDIYILNEHKICIFKSTPSTTNIYTITGDCIGKTIEIESETYYYVEVYGDCAISMQGAR